jgi:tetratricopeptide (TPR) repeat protein
MMVSLFVAVLCCAAVSEGAGDDVLALLQKGDFTGARSAVEQAYAESPDDTGLIFLYAKTRSDPAKALEAFKSLGAIRSVPDSIRSEAFFRLGCASYMRGRMQKASQYLKKACAFSTSPSYRSALYLCAIHDTADTGLASSLDTQATDNGGASCSRFYYATLLFAKKNYADALPRFIASTDSLDTLDWSCPAFAGAYCCAAFLNRPAEASSTLDHLRRVFPSYLEKPMVARAKLSLQNGPLKDSTARDTSAATLKKDAGEGGPKKAVQKTPFSLQVGSFSAIENAEALKVSLARAFSPVSVVSGTAANKTVYRVRVGAFETREAAQAFGDSAVTKKGLQFRIIEE